MTMEPVARRASACEYGVYAGLGVFEPAIDRHDHVHRMVRHGAGMMFLACAGFDRGAPQLPIEPHFGVHEGARGTKNGGGFDAVQVGGELVEACL